MNNKKKIDLNTCLDEEQVRVLIDLETTTRQSIASLLKESIELYVKFKNGEIVHVDSLHSPIVFERSSDQDGDS